MTGVQTCALPIFAAKGQRTAAGRRAVVRLLPHRSSTGVATAKVPLTLAPGTYSLVACADATLIVLEANERDNCRTSATTVVRKPPPPLRPAPSSSFPSAFHRLGIAARTSRKQRGNYPQICPADLRTYVP